MLKLIAYKGLSSETIQMLRHDGFDVYYLAPDLESDQTLAQKANGEGYLLITGDADFADEAHRQGLVQSGIVLLKTEDNIPEWASMIKVLVKEAERLKNAYSVITRKGLVKNIKLGGV
jgi:predicted nuclease of predicted toxin-antitoxin system